MIITREGIMEYWLSEPKRHCRPGYISIGAIPFPDVETLSPAEKKLFRKLLRRHPEYLHEIILRPGKPQ